MNCLQVHANLRQINPTPGTTPGLIGIFLAVPNRSCLGINEWVHANLSDSQTQTILEDRWRLWFRRQWQWMAAWDGRTQWMASGWLARWAIRPASIRPAHPKHDSGVGDCGLSSSPIYASPMCRIRFGPKLTPWRPALWVGALQDRHGQKRLSRPKAPSPTSGTWMDLVLSRNGWNWSLSHDCDPGSQRLSKEWSD